MLLHDFFQDGEMEDNEGNHTPEPGEWRQFFYGGFRGNPGNTGAGAVMIQNGTSGWRIRWAAYEYLGDNSTNNRAEYASLVLGLEEAEARGL